MSSLARLLAVNPNHSKAGFVKKYLVLPIPETISWAGELPGGPSPLI
jgi:hypothetical protein